MSEWRLGFWPIVLISLFVLVACSPSGPDDAGEQSVYRHAIEGAPTSLDPAHAATAYADMVVVNLYDTLYRYKYLARPYELAPNLADGMPEVSADGLRYTFRIRDNAHFVDDEAFPDGRGRPVTVHDLIYSLKRHFDPETRSQGAWLWSGKIEGLDAWGEQGADYSASVSGLQALDDHTLQVTLAEPYPQLIYTLATGFSALVPREAVEHYGREFGIKPVGSGPFRLTTFDSTRALFKRNPYFQRPALNLDVEGFDAERHEGLGLEALDDRHYPIVDELEIHFIAENASRWSAFSSGAVDSILVPNEQIDRVLASRDPIELTPDFSSTYHHREAVEAGFIYGGFNMADERFGHHADPERAAANRELRCAVRDAYDWQARNRTFHYGIGEIFPGVIPPLVPEFDERFSRDSVAGDVEQGKRRLEAAGWTADTLPVLTYGLPPGVQQRQIYDQFRTSLLELGFPPDRIRAQTFATFGDFARALKNRQLDLFFIGWLLDYPDAQNTLQLFYGPFETPGSNSVNYRNPVYDQLYRQSVAMMPGPERTSLYQQMNKIVVEDCAVISGLSRKRIQLWSRRMAMWPDQDILNGFFLRFVAERARD